MKAAKFIGIYALLILCSCDPGPDKLFTGPAPFTLGPISAGTTKQSVISGEGTCKPIENSPGAWLCDMKTFPSFVAKRPTQRPLTIFQGERLGAFSVSIVSDISTVTGALEEQYGKACQTVDRGSQSVRRWCFDGGNLLITNRGLPDQGNLVLLYLQDKVLPEDSPAAQIVSLLGDPVQ